MNTIRYQPNYRPGNNEAKAWCMKTVKKLGAVLQRNYSPEDLERVVASYGVTGGHAFSHVVNSVPEKDRELAGKVRDKLMREGVFLKEGPTTFRLRETVPQARWSSVKDTGKRVTTITGATIVDESYQDWPWELILRVGTQPKHKIQFVAPSRHLSIFLGEEVQHSTVWRNLQENPQEHPRLEELYSMLFWRLNMTQPFYRFGKDTFLCNKSASNRIDQLIPSITGKAYHRIERIETNSLNVETRLFGGQIYTTAGQEGFVTNADI